MADDITITVEGLKETQAAFLSLAQALKPFVKGAARISADNVAREARARLERQLSGTSTGKTVASITVQSDRTGWGWVVVAGDPSQKRVAFWLERGTQRMSARSFFDSSAQLEAHAHEGRIQAAVVAGISTHGFGLGDR